MNKKQANQLMYRFKKDSWLKSRRNAQEVGRTLEVIRRENDNHLTSEAVLEAAEDVRSPLHEFFDWDDKAAAKKHRMGEASKLIASIEVIYPETNHEPVSYYCSVKKMGAAKPSFIPVKIAMNTPYFRNQLLNDAIENFEKMKRKFGHLRQLEKVFTTYAREKKKLIAQEKIVPEIQKVEAK